MIRPRWLFPLALAAIFSSASAETTEYLGNDALEEALRTAVAADPGRFEMKELTRDHRDRPI